MKLMNILAKYGDIKLLMNSKSSYEVIISNIADNKSQTEKIIKKLSEIGYRNAHLVNNKFKI